MAKKRSKGAKHKTAERSNAVETYKRLFELNQWSELSIASTIVLGQLALLRKNEVRHYGAMMSELRASIILPDQKHTSAILFFHMARAHFSRFGFSSAPC